MAGTGTARHPTEDGRAVLIADPNPERFRPVAAALARECEVEFAHDGENAWSALARRHYAAALVNAGLPKVSGLETLRRLADRPSLRRPLVMAVGAAGDVRLQVIRTHKLADLVQPTPCPDAVLLRQIWSLLDLDVEQRLAGRSPEQRRLLRTTHGLLDVAATAVARGAGLPAEVIEVAGRAVVDALASGSMMPLLGELQNHHDYTYVHSVRVAAHLAAFALETGMRASDALLLAQAGLLHDVGKTAVPAAVLDKPGPLVDEEWTLVRHHPATGGEMLRRTPDLPPQLVAITERHHERLDGSGYPRGLAGAAIDEPSLLCAIADVHTALTDRRAYRAPLTNEEAFARMHELADRQLDRALLHRYEEVIRDGPIAAIRPPTASGSGLIPA